VNLHAVLSASPGQVVSPVGLKGHLLGRLNRASRPLTVALVGAIFAVSFDTVSQSALFALTATQFGGVAHALFLGMLFVFGMLVTDGINGLWISRLIARADQLACTLRVMGLAVSSVSLLVAALWRRQLASPAIDQWTEGRQPAFARWSLWSLRRASVAVPGRARTKPAV
jgi:high-affinity nickel-transport protein